MADNEGRIGFFAKKPFALPVDDFPDLDVDDLVKVFELSTPSNYHRPILDNPESSRIIRGIAAVHAEVARRAIRTQQALFWRDHAYARDEPAQVAQNATFTATLRRSSSWHLPLTIGIGEFVLTGPGNRRYANTAEISFIVGQEEEIGVEFASVLPGYAANLDHYEDPNNAGFLLEDTLAIEVRSFDRAGITADLFTDSGSLFLRDTGENQIFGADDPGIYVEITQAATSATVGLFARVTSFSQSNVQIPPDSDLFPNTVELETGATPPDESGTISWRLLDWIDLGFVVEDATPPTGGTDDHLYMLGDNRGIYRQPGETAEGFRKRGSTLQDVVSPNAINRAVNLELQDLGLTGLAIDVQVQPLGNEEEGYRGIFWDVDFWDYYTVPDLVSHGTARAVSLANISPLSGTLAVDGVALVAGDIVLLTAQSTPSENGAWVVDAGAWSRDPDWGFGGEAEPFLTRIEEGGTYADTLWIAEGTPGDTIGVDDLAVTQVTDDQFPESKRYRLLSRQEATGWFFVFVPPLGLDDSGIAYDMTGSEGVFDIGPEFVGPAWDSFGWDTTTAEESSVYSSIYSSVLEKKAGFVGFTMILDEDP